MNKKIIGITIFNLFALIVYSQQFNNFGVPYIKNFKNHQEKLYSHSWNIDEAPNKIIYMVNDKGLLEFDGISWKRFVGSKGITRSLKVANDSLIYTGSDNDFGFWRLNKENEFEYKSLFEKIRNKNLVEEFWNVFMIEQKAIFLSFHNLYIYNKGNFTIIKAPKKFICAKVIKNSIYLIDEKEGLMVIEDNQLTTINTNISINYSDIVSIDYLDEKINLVTKKDGIIDIYNQKINQYNALPEFNNGDIVFCFKRISKDCIALGTIQNGVIIMNNNGAIVHKLNKNNGLQNNTVLSMHYSSSGYLWLGLDFGVDAIHLNNPISYLIDYTGIMGTTYTAFKENSKCYLGTNQGLYTCMFEMLKNTGNKFNYRLIPNSNGQIWSIQNIDNNLYIGHDKGLFQLKNEQLFLIDKQSGVQTILKYKNYILTGNYDGVNVYKSTQNSLKFEKKIPKLYGSFKQLLMYENKLFAQLPNEGVLEFELDSNLNLTRKVLYPKSIFSNQPFQIKLTGNSLWVYTIDSIYKKEIYKNNFSSYKYSQNTILKNMLLQDNFLPIFADSIVHFYSIYNGFSIQFSKHNRFSNETKISKPLIRSVFAFSNSEKVKLINLGKVNNSINNVLINFILPSLDENIEYQYSLDTTKGWSNWSNNTSVEYLNLKEGKYKFSLRAKVNNQISEIVTYEFSVNPPFYRSWGAYVFYLLSIVLGIYGIRFYSRQKLKKQKLEILLRQKELLDLQAKKYREKLELERREKLELEKIQLRKTLEGKELELAKKTIDQMEINEIVLSIKKKLEEVQINAGEKLANKSFQDLINFIDKKINTDVAKEYEIAFDSSQTKFHENLLKAHSSLSVKDLRICSYLMMNLSSKEISKLLNVLPSSIDVGRSRLRKKLNLEESEHLRDYLAKFI